MNGSTSDPITRDHVETAVRELREAGRRTSWREVRKHLGRGSPNTILDHLRALDATTRSQAAAQEPAPPAAITDLVGSKVWQAALTAARAQVEQEKRELEERLQAEEARCSDLAGLVERLEEQVIEARRQADAQIEALRSLAQGQQQMAAEQRAGQAILTGVATALDAHVAQSAERHAAHLDQGRAVQASLADLRQDGRDAQAAAAVTAAGHAEDLRGQVAQEAAALATALAALAATQEATAQAASTARDHLIGRIDELAGSMRSECAAARAAQAVAEREAVATAQALAGAEARARLAEQRCADLDREWRTRWDEQRTDIQRGWGDLRTALAAALAAVRPAGSAPSVHADPPPA